MSGIQRKLSWMCGLWGVWLLICASPAGAMIGFFMAWALIILAVPIMAVAKATQHLFGLQEVTFTTVMKQCGMLTETAIAVTIFTLLVLACIHYCKGNKERASFYLFAAMHCIFAIASIVIAMHSLQTAWH